MVIYELNRIPILGYKFALPVKDKGIQGLYKCKTATGKQAS
jgi:hypothetical protein